MMSIRFRLTLLYSTILALTLLVFGVALYSIQARDTLNSLEHDLLMSSEKLASAALRTGPPPPQEAVQREPPPPKPFEEFSSEQAFQALPEREIARILDADGNLVASPFGRAEDALPLSEAGLAALNNQQDWWESGEVGGEKMLIYSRPITASAWGQEEQAAYIVQVARPLTERDRSLKSLATTLGGAGLLTILVAFGAGWALSGLSLRPIHRITQTAQAIGEERDFTRRVAYRGPQDEVGRLANTFNQMLSRLQDAYQKVEYSLEQQRNFVADVSHELRTPLTTLRGNLGLLGRTPPAPPEEQADILADMVAESDRLIRLVNDLLLLAYADAGRSLAKVPLALQHTLEETIRLARQLDAGRGISLDVAQDLSILGDRDAFKQVMLILLDNALKHSGGEIHVRARRDGAQVEICVQDHGRGISPDKLEHVFDRFYRGDDNPIVEGYGLGLPIAKALSEGMGGSIAIESELEQGSSVTLRFSALAPQD
ncbi:MAG: HAMP domain-containing histidine kinase [Anaerolineales bacterium]|nr:HAMP domain-containing histidine kinase [Anaerolineales bacterium]